jgi:ubiquinone/menaquinone biosynthesis C-methylase UbiE
VSSVRDFYEKDASKRGAGRSMEKTQVISLSMLNISCSDIVLEIGCGGGALLSEIKRRGATAIGVDISINQVKYANKQLRNVDVIVCDAAYLPFRNNHFTQCFAIEVLEHVQNPSAVMNEIHRVLENNSELIIVVPNDRNWFIHRILEGHFSAAFYDYGHLHDFSSIKKITPFLKGFEFLTARENIVATIPLNSILSQLFRIFYRVLNQKNNLTPTKKYPRDDVTNRLPSIRQHFLFISPKLALHLIIKLKKR